MKIDRGGALESDVIEFRAIYIPARIFQVEIYHCVSLTRKELEYNERAVDLSRRRMLEVAQAPRTSLNLP